MSFIHVFVLIKGAVLVLGNQNSYDVTQERLEKVYDNHAFADLTCGVYKSNRTTNAANVSLKINHALTDKDMAFITGYKWLSNEYRLDILQFQDTIKNIFNIQYFDMQRLRCNYTTPPLVWPMKSGVTYHVLNWIPDSTAFPPGMPEGRWKILINYTKANRTPIAAVNWYIKIQYRVKWFESEAQRQRRQ